MTDAQRIAEIESREKAATEGPWSWEDWDLDDGPDCYTLVAPPHTRPSGTSGMFPDLGFSLMTDEDHEISEQDRAFIAHARQDVPWLIEELRASQAREVAMREALERALEWIDAVPRHTILPEMPGFDRDEVNGLLDRLALTITPGDGE